MPRPAGNSDQMWPCFTRHVCPGHRMTLAIFSSVGKRGSTDIITPTRNLLVSLRNRSIAIRLVSPFYSESILSPPFSASLSLSLSFSISLCTVSGAAIPHRGDSTSAEDTRPLLGTFIFIPAEKMAPLNYWVRSLWEGRSVGPKQINARSHCEGSVMHDDETNGSRSTWPVFHVE